jgi:hypothetical protein
VGRDFVRMALVMFGVLVRRDVVLGRTGLVSRGMFGFDEVSKVR